AGEALNHAVDLPPDAADVRFGHGPAQVVAVDEDHVRLVDPDPGAGRLAPDRPAELEPRRVQQIGRVREGDAEARTREPPGIGLDRRLNGFVRLPRVHLGLGTGVGRRRARPLSPAAGGDDRRKEHADKSDPVPQPAPSASMIGLKAMRITHQWNPGESTVPADFQDTIYRIVGDMSGMRIVVSLYGRPEDTPRTDEARQQYCSYVADLTKVNPQITDI